MEKKYEKRKNKGGIVARRRELIERASRVMGIYGAPDNSERQARSLSNSVNTGAGSVTPIYPGPRALKQRRDRARADMSFLTGCAASARARRRRPEG